MQACVRLAQLSILGCELQHQRHSSLVCDPRSLVEGGKGHDRSWGKDHFHRSEYRFWTSRIPHHSWRMVSEERQNAIVRGGGEGV